MSEQLSYAKAGVNIDVADATKRAMAASLESSDARVLNRIGAFASLVDGRFVEYEHPILVLKTEEPGSKQKLAFANGRAGSIGYDLINHLIDDIIVMGADPLFVQDCIVCGHLESEVVKELVAALAAACREQGCTLVGGETSEQPGVLERGTYILSASIVGVVDKAKIIDGSRIEQGDVVLALASNGLHTNGYSLVRALMQQKPEILQRQVEDESFLDAILRPHRCYYQPLRGLFSRAGLHGLAHITGGGIQDNLNRILPKTLDARIDRAAIRILPLFKLIREMGQLEDADMQRTFNLGIGITAVCAPNAADEIVAHLKAHDCAAYPIGEIAAGSGAMRFEGALRWD